MIGIILFIQIPVIFSLSIGEEIDKFERDKLKIFPEIEDFQKAYAFKIDKDYQLIIKTSFDSIALTIDSLRFYQFIEYIDYFDEINTYPEIKEEFENKWENKGIPVSKAFFLGNLKILYPLEKPERKPESIEIYEKRREVGIEKLKEFKKGDVLYPDDPLSRIIDFDSNGIPVTKFEVNAVKGITGRVSGILGGLFLGIITFLNLKVYQNTPNTLLSFFVPVFTFSFTGYLIGNIGDEKEAIKKIKELRKKRVFLPPSLMLPYTYDRKGNPILRAEIEARKGFGWRGIIGLPIAATSLYIPFNIGAYYICDYFDTQNAISKAKKLNIRNKEGIPFYLEEIYHITTNK